MRREPRSPRSASSSLRQLVRAEQAGAERVVDVVVDVGDPVDEADDLALEGGRLVRPRVVEDPVAGLDREVQAAPVALEELDDAQRLLVVAEAAAEALRKHLVERLLARVAERGVAEVVPERDRLGQILVQPQGPGDGAGDAGGLERVREPRAVVVALRVDEDLRLVLEAPERLAVDDPVAVALERRPEPAFLFLRMRTPARLVGAHGARGKPHLLLLANAGLEPVRDSSG